MTWASFGESGYMAALGRAVMADEESDTITIVPSAIVHSGPRWINSISGYEKGFMVFYSFEYTASGTRYNSFRCRTVRVP